MMPSATKQGTAPSHWWRNVCKEALEIPTMPGASPEVAEAVVKRVRHNVFKTTLDLRSRMIRCSVSIGVVNYPKDARDMRELLSIADRKMYRDKELRRAPGSEASA